MQSSTSLHVFSLPPELLESITLRDVSSAAPQVVNDDVPDEESTKDGTTSEGKTCTICSGISFSSIMGQREHFRSDWHRYNVKAKLSNKRLVSEAEFADLLETLDDSLSGSESSEDDEERASDPDAVRMLLAKSTIHSRPESLSVPATPIPQTALAWFHSPPSTQIGVYRSIFSPKAPKEAYIQELKALQTPVSGGRKWAMFMVAGGHFAGIVVRVSKSAEPEVLEPLPKGKQRKPQPLMEILRHKTFHRYTTRRKQGGSQSVNDNAKGNAKSAGAQLRRYGEQALREDIRGLLSEWSEELAGCERIWLRASAANRRIFTDYDAAIIEKGDRRLRTFPFPTRRPTQSELSRCLMELTYVKVTHFTEDELRAQDEDFLASLPKPRPLPPQAPAQELRSPEKKPPKLSKEEELLRDKWSRLLEMIKKGKLDVTRNFWDREGAGLGGVNAAVPEWAGERGGTLLQVAARAGHPDVVQWLLEDLRADPTVAVPTNSANLIADEEKAHDTDTSDIRVASSNGFSRRAAYDLAANRAVRDVFRRCAAEHSDWWDWLGAARVPTALSKEMEEEREEKKKSRRKGLKDKIKEREAKEKERGSSVESVERVTEIEKPPTKVVNIGAPQKLGGKSGAGDVVAGLTPEMRARLERERRARAAEARLKTLGGS